MLLSSHLEVTSTSKSSQEIRVKRDELRRKIGERQVEGDEWREIKGRRSKSSDESGERQVKRRVRR